MDIGQPREGHLLLLPIALERAGSIRTDRQDLGASRGELLVILAQPRQVRAAVRSGKAAVED